MLLVACVETPIESPNQANETATRASDLEGKDYYWSGGRKIYLDIDYTKMIVGFDSEPESTKMSSATTSKGRSYTGKTTALIDVRDESVREKITADKSVKYKTYARKYTGYEDAPFYMTGDIVMQPKGSVSPEEILAKYDVDVEAVNKTDIGVIIRLKDWDKLLSTANTIYESGMVDWCHPDFVSLAKIDTNDQYFGRQYYLKNTAPNGVDINVEPAKRPLAPWKLYFLVQIKL